MQYYTDGNEYSTTYDHHFGRDPKFCMQYSAGMPG